MKNLTIEFIIFIIAWLCILAIYQYSTERQAYKNKQKQKKNGKEIIF